MTPGRNKRHWTSWILILLVFLQAISGIFGGIGLVMDPSGGSFQMPASLLEGSPFSTFLIPGLILLIILGIFPIFAWVGLVWEPEWPWANFLNVYRHQKWGWSYALYTGIMLIVWITIELQIIREHHVLHTIYDLLGVTICIAALLPPVMKTYAR